MKTKSILLIIILIAALAGGLLLVKNNQETRSGASFANVEALFLPSEKTLRVGEKLTTTFMIDTKDRLLTGADLRVKYEQSVLKLESVENVWPKGEDEVIISNINDSAGIYELVGANTQKEINGLPRGVVSIVKLNFVAIANGQAVVGLDKSYGNMTTGYNEAGSDQELTISQGNNAIYQIVGLEVNATRSPIEVECAWCGEACIEKSEKQNFACLDVMVEGKKCVSQEDKCVVIDGYATE